MKPFLIVLATQIPFLVFMALVPPERRGLTRRTSAALTASIALGAIAWGVYRLDDAPNNDGRVWIGLGVCGLALAFASLRGWIGPRDDELY